MKKKPAKKPSNDQGLESWIPSPTADTSPQDEKYVLREGLLRSSILTATTQKLYNYIALADQKATGLIILNSFIIPLTMNAFDKDDFKIPATIAIVTSIVSVFLAIWCIFPKRREASKPGGERNLLHFTDIGSLKERDYLEQILPIYNHTGALAEEVLKDIHDVSHRVLIPKFRLLKWCYAVFFMGNVVAILSFLIPGWH